MCFRKTRLRVSTTSPARFACDEGSHETFVESPRRASRFPGAKENAALGVARGGGKQGTFGFLKTYIGHPLHSSSRVAASFDASRGPRGPRPGASAGADAGAGAGTSAEGGARTHRLDRCATRSASHEFRVFIIRVGVRERPRRSRGRVRPPRIPGLARHSRTRRDEARGIERARAVVRAPRGVGERDGPSLVASVSSPRRARLDRRARRDGVDGLDE